MAANRTIDINTTQNVTIEYELASLRERFLAFFIDALVIFVIMLFVIGLVYSIYSDSAFEDLGNRERILSLMPVAIFILYQFVSEVLANGQSLGKKAVGIKVVRLDGKDPSIIDYLLRAVFHIVDTLFSTGIVGGLLISSTSKSQRLGDMTANTAVIRIKYRLHFLLEDILKIQTIEDYEPQFLGIKNFNEGEMLLIKNVISRYKRYPNDAHKSAIMETVRRCMDLLEITEVPKDKIGFLKTLIRDYIVLTR